MRSAGEINYKKNIDSNKLFLCCDECMSCWENEDDLTQQRKKFMEYSIKSKIANASEDDISNFHWENINYTNVLIHSSNFINCS